MEAWLTKVCGLPQYVALFARQGIDVSALLHINDDGLKAAGVATALHRRKLLLNRGKLSDLDDRLPLHASDQSATQSLLRLGRDGHSLAVDRSSHGDDVEPWGSHPASVDLGGAGAVLNGRHRDWSGSVPSLPAPPRAVAAAAPEALDKSLRMFFDKRSQPSGPSADDGGRGGNSKRGGRSWPGGVWLPHCTAHSSPSAVPDGVVSNHVYVLDEEH